MPVLGELARWGYQWAWSAPRSSERVDLGAIFRLAPGLVEATEPRETSSSSSPTATARRHRASYTLTLPPTARRSRAAVRRALADVTASTPPGSARSRRCATSAAWRSPATASWRSGSSPSWRRLRVRAAAADSELPGRLRPGAGSARLNPPPPEPAARAVLWRYVSRCDSWTSKERRAHGIPGAGIEPAEPLRAALFKSADFASLSTRARGEMLDAAQDRNVF